MKANHKTLLLTLLLAVQASACTVVPVSRPYYYPRETVYAAPPRVEYVAQAYVAPAPVVGQVWIGTSPGWGSGYRDFRQRRHEHRHEHRGWR